jgi:hypothetical protein
MLRAFPPKETKLSMSAQQNIGGNLGVVQVSPMASEVPGVVVEGVVVAYIDPVAISDAAAAVAEGKFQFGP